jgi:hypothetical protein
MERARSESLISFPRKKTNDNCFNCSGSSKRSKEIREAAAEVLLPRVIEWIACDSPPTESEAAEIKAQIAEALDHYDTDGYKLAKELESKGYDSDAWLVEILDDTSHIMREEHKKLVKQWVIDQKIEPPLPMNTQVFIFNGGKKVKGEIVDIYRETAEYVVFFEESGHKRNASGKPTGFIFEYERAKAVTDEPGKEV